MQDENYIPISVTFNSYFLHGELTVYSEQVRLHHILIPESMTRVIARVFQLYVCQVETAVVEDANLRKHTRCNCIMTSSSLETISSR